MPETSIITPTYNREHLLDDLIKNVLSQTYQDFELIIIDDGSTDNTKSVVQKWQEQNPRKIVYIYQENQGAAGARNNGIEHAKGEYVAFLDSDDSWSEDFLKKTIHELKEADYDWVVTAAQRTDIDANGEHLKSTVIKTDIQKNSKFFSRQLSVYEGLLTGNVVGETSRVVVKKSILNEVGGFRQELRLSQDYELWLRLAQKGYKLSVIEEPLVHYQKSLDSLTKTKYAQALAAGYSIIIEYLPDAVKLSSNFYNFYSFRLKNYSRDLLYGHDKDFILFVKCVFMSVFFKFRFMMAGEKKK